jgi:hypothetical protein
MAAFHYWTIRVKVALKVLVALVPLTVTTLVPAGTVTNAPL